MSSIVESNGIVISGEVISEPIERFKTDSYAMYQFKIKVIRTSGKCDELIIQADSKMITNKEVKVGNYYKIHGDVRTYKNMHPQKGEGKLLVCILAKVMTKIDAVNGADENECHLCGTLKRKRELKSSKDNSPIREFVIETTRDKYNKVCYIPCVSWKDNATIITGIEDGTGIKCIGRFQSRNYTNMAGEDMTCYEVAVKSIDKTEV